MSDGGVTVKEYLMDTINERDRKYEQRFGSLDKTITELNESLKEALKTALQTTSDALEKATYNTAAALTTANENIRGVREQMLAQAETFARKAEIEQAIAAMKEAVIKAENSTEKRFEAVNEFRNQMGDMQASLVRKTEVDIRFDALENKLETAVRNLSASDFRRGGRDNALYLGIGVLAWLAAMAIPIVLHFMR